MTIQETLRAALAADAAVAALVGARIYPGEIPDDDTPSPFIFYAVPESVPLMEDLDGGPVDVRSTVELHAVADRYADAVALMAAVDAVLTDRRDGAIRQATWLGSTEEQTEEGHHHAARYSVLWVRG